MVDEYQKERIKFKEQINELKNKNFELLENYKKEIHVFEDNLHALED